MEEFIKDIESALKDKGVKGTVVVILNESGHSSYTYGELTDLEIIGLLESSKQRHINR